MYLVGRDCISGEKPSPARIAAALWREGGREGGRRRRGREEGREGGREKEERGGEGGKEGGREGGRGGKMGMRGRDKRRMYEEGEGKWG